jgi:hypothetical protein
MAPALDRFHRIDAIDSNSTLSFLVESFDADQCSLKTLPVYRTHWLDEDAILKYLTDTPPSRVAFDHRSVSFERQLKPELLLMLTPNSLPPSIQVSCTSQLDLRQFHWA